MAKDEYVAGLGALYSLPFELRRFIWEYVSFQPVQAALERPAWKLGFLQTSRQVYDEASPIAYQHAALRFTVQPTYAYRSWLSVERYGTSRFLLQDLVDVKYRGFGLVPFEKLEEIQIDIEAPAPEDPGQIVCLFKKCVDLVTLLECAKHSLPKLKIRLLDSTSAKWSLEGEPQKSVGPPRNGSINRGIERTHMMWHDYQNVLYPFSRLRNVRSAKIQAPVVGDRCQGFVSHTAAVMMREDPLGSNQDPDDILNDGALQEDLEDIFIDLEDELDILPGPTADFLRVDRFSSWYTDRVGGHSRYEDLYERIFRSRDALQLEGLSESLGRLQWRYALLRAINPKNLNSFLYEYCSSHYAARESSPVANGIDCTGTAINHETKREMRDWSHPVSDQWDRDAWHTYIYALKPFNYHFYEDFDFKGTKAFHLLRCMSEFGDKLASWGIDRLEIVEAKIIVRWELPGKMSDVPEMLGREITWW